MLNLAVTAAPLLPSDPARTYSGRDGRLDVSLPRIQAKIVVDGRLDEPAWNEAALLTGFSLYAPVDGRPAPDSTEVFVWYSDASRATVASAPIQLHARQSE